MQRTLFFSSRPRLILGMCLGAVTLIGLLLMGMPAAMGGGRNLVVNGSFESGNFAPWTVGGTLSTPIITDKFATGGTLSARLGEPVEPITHTAGTSWVAQTIHVPDDFREPELVFHYRIITNDIKDWASFRAEVRDLSGDRLELIRRDGYDPPSNAAIPGYDMGWQVGRFDLSAYRGTTIQLYFESRNEHDEALGLWTYLDEVSVTNRSRVFVPLVARNHRGFVPTATSSPTMIATLTDTPTSTTTPTATHTATATLTATPSDTPTPTMTPGWYAWPPPTTRRIFDVAVVSDGTAWAVGEAGLILRFDGRGWRPWSGFAPTSGDLTAVHAVSPGDVWAVMDTGALLHFDGTDWSLLGPLTPEGEALWDIHMTAGGEAGWAVGEAGTIVQFDGANWYRLPEQLVPTGYTLRAVYTVSEHAAWAVGDEGTILRYENGSWTNWSRSRPQIQTSATLWDVQMAGAGTGWIVGGSGTMMRYFDGAWYILAPPPVYTDLYALDLLAPDRGWAVGDFGTLLSYNELNWLMGDILTGAALRGVDLLTSGNGWAVGADGALLRRGFAWEVPTVTPTHRPPTPTWTATATATGTPTASVTLTPTFTTTPSPTATSTPSTTTTPTLTPSTTTPPTTTSTATISPTSTLSSTPSSTVTLTRTLTPASP